MGITEYSVDTDLYIDENFCIIIQEIRIAIPNENKEKTDEFSQKLKARLGVPISAECK